MNVIEHYDLLIEEDNDPVHDDPIMQDYMNKWDGIDFINELQLDGKQNVLEIGVGTGRLALKVVPKCKYFTGIDISPKTIDRAKENLVEFKNKTLICADFLEYTFDIKFDVVYSSLTFLHIQDKQKALTKISDILKPEGRLILSISKEELTEIDFGNRKLEIYPDHPHHIIACLSKTNLNIIKQFETEFAWTIVCVK